VEVELDKWIGLYKVRAFPWIDGKRICFNVQYYEPGQSVEKPPAWDKTVYVTDNDAGRKLVYNLTNTLVECVANMRLDENAEVTLTA
jgi:hypothetical protein